VSDARNPVKAFFNKPIRPSASSPISRYTHAQIASLIPDDVQERAIAVDLGCNDGRYTSILAERFEIVYGLDFAQAAMRRMPKQRNIRLIAVDLNTIPQHMWLSLKVDFALAVGLFEMLPNPDRLCRVLEEWIVPRGRLLVVMPKPGTLHLRALRAMFALRAAATGFEQPPLYHNGHSLATVTPMLASCRLDLAEAGACVGVPASVFSRLPRLIQALAIRFDQSREKSGSGCYEFGLYIRQ
jgi:SAM-dependent methyltransferase